MFINGMGCYFPGWGVIIWNRVLETGWGVTFRDGVLLNVMGCYFLGWGVSVWDGVLVNGIEC